MGKKLLYKDVKNFIEVESGSGCKLISEEYLGNDKILKIQCKCGEYFDVRFADFKFKNQRQCGICSGHINWDYNKVKFYIETNSNCKLLSTEYIDSRTKLELICECDTVFYCTFLQFKDQNKRQCNECGIENRAKLNRLSLEYINKFVKDNSNCELVSIDYISVDNILEFKCGCGNYFSTSFHEFQSGNKRQCNECGKINQFINTTKTHEEFCQELFIKYKDEYTVLGKYKTDKEYILIQHNKCGHKWDITPNSILKQKRCPNCFKQQNFIHEGIARNFLCMNNIYFIDEYKNINCRDKRLLKFDFAIFNNIEKTDLYCIFEIDGRQHFEPVNFGGISDEKALENFKITQYHDSIKNKYCEDNGIRLIRIPYWDFNKIEEILKKELIIY